MATCRFPSRMIYTAANRRATEYAPNFAGVETEQAPPLFSSCIVHSLNNGQQPASRTILFSLLTSSNPSNSLTAAIQLVGEC